MKCTSRWCCWKYCKCKPHITTEAGVPRYWEKPTEYLNVRNLIAWIDL